MGLSLHGNRFFSLPGSNRYPFAEMKFILLENRVICMERDEVVAGKEILQGSLACWVEDQQN